MPDDDLVDRFLRALQRPREGTAPRPVDDRVGVAAALTAALDRWPDLEVTPEELGRYLAARSPSDPASPVAVDALHLDDLALACACMPPSPDARRAEAARVLDREHREALHAAVQRLGEGPAFVEEMCQRVYDHLLVGSHDRPPRLLEYNGRGSLRAFLRVVGVRIALQELRRRGRRREDPDEKLLEMGAAGDFELQYMQDLYRRPVREAFAAAMRDLDPRARSLLRYQVVDRLSIDEIASIYAIHRSTAARQLARARRALVEATHLRLREALGLGHEDLASVLRLVQSQVDLSVRRLLGPEPPS